MVEGGQRARSGDAVEVKEVKLDPATGDLSAAAGSAAKSETGSVAVTQR
ncbi:hypothetical protein [Rhizobium sp. G21]|nr:hypothetical protein [Rhizobium sp. G21]